MGRITVSSVLAPTSLHAPDWREARGARWQETQEFRNQPLGFSPSPLSRALEETEISTPLSLSLAELRPQENAEGKCVPGG